MKYSLCFLLLCFVGYAQQPLVPEGTNVWLTDYKEALKTAKKDSKNVLVYFTGSDWCPPCRLLKKDLFDTGVFHTISKEYVLLYVDMPRKKGILTEQQMAHNKALLSSLNKKGVFPLLKILDPQGKILDEMSGYAGYGKVSKHLDLLERYR